MVWADDKRLAFVKASKARAGELRKSMTKEEARPWLELRTLRSGGFHFRRQAPFLGFYLDFVCFSRRLVIEIDGGQHADEANAEHDAVRDAILRRRGFETIRFWNREITCNLDGVVDTVRAALGERPKSGAPDGPGPTLAASRPVPPHEGEECAPGRGESGRVLGVVLPLYGRGGRPRSGRTEGAKGGKLDDRHGGKKSGGVAP